LTKNASESFKYSLNENYSRKKNGKNRDLADVLHKWVPHFPEMPFRFSVIRILVTYSGLSGIINLVKTYA
jgi:hypothetical protein